MKEIIILGGNHISNLDWMKKLESTLDFDFNVKKIEYLHWKNDNPEEIDFDDEMVELEKTLSSKNNVNIIAKSAGVILALLAIQKGIISPDKVVFIGIPVKWALERNINVQLLFNFLTANSLIIQQDQDYMISFKDLLSLLKQTNYKNYKTLKIKGSDHTYSNIEDFKDEIISFIEGKNI